MASHQEFVLEWTMLDSDYTNWSASDLQLAAELGRTLLERNEELENELKAQQVVIEDQGQEITFLTKQITSMKEESLSRTKVYEQLESSLSDLERHNADLNRKHELDKKRMQSLCENIDYLERKCEELSGTLDSLRDSNKKHYNNGKINQSGYFNFGSSDSSEDDSGCGYGFRRRSQSLQDLRDYSPSPDDMDSNHSNSPDLKTSEAEFVGTLEARVEELIGAKKKEVEKITQLENQLRLLIQENSNLQQKLIQVTNEKNDQIEDLRIQLLDQSSAFSHQSPPRYNSHSIFPTPVMSPDGPTDQFLPFANFNSLPSHNHNLSSPTSTKSNILRNKPKPVCRRCSTEIHVLNLINSIEMENEDYSSLEFELARAEEEAQAQSAHLNSDWKSNDNHFEEHSTNGGPTNSSNCEEDSCLLKDFGPEVFTKRCDDTVRHRKLKLPAKIPAADMYSNDSNAMEELPTEDTLDGRMDLQEPSFVEPKINLQQRSKLWWLVWVFVVLFGIVQFIWTILSFTFSLAIAAILPKSSHSNSPIAASPRRLQIPFRESCRKSS